MVSSKLIFLITLIIGCLLTIGCEKQPDPMVINSSDPLVQKFYDTNNQSLFWFSSKRNIKKAKEWLVELQSSNRHGIDAEYLQIDQIYSLLLNKNKISSSLRDEADQQLTGLVLNFMKELQEGKVKRDQTYLKRNNLAVINANGVEVEVTELEWMEYTEKNFPYFFRQSTGSRNAMGVLKFDFQNPYSVYLHSTNMQSAFLNDDRFLSHGCIRLENPIDLANSLLHGKLDIEELKTGKKDTETVKIILPQKVPVFIIYSLVSVEGNRVAFLSDVYGSVQQR
jgi:hypothetical protein